MSKKNNQKSEAMKKLQDICNNTNDPNFAQNYQLGVMNLLTESIGLTDEVRKAMQSEGTKKIKSLYDDDDIIKKDAKEFDERLKDFVDNNMEQEPVNKNVLQNQIQEKVMGLLQGEIDHAEMMFECAKVNKSEWDGVNEVKYSRERTRMLVYSNMSKRFEQIQKKLNNFFKYL